MKEFYLVPANEMTLFHNRGILNDENRKEKELFNKEIPKGEIMELDNQINRLRRETRKLHEVNTIQNRENFGYNQPTLHKVDDVKTVKKLQNNDNIHNTKLHNVNPTSIANSQNSGKKKKIENIDVLKEYEDQIENSIEIVPRGYTHEVRYLLRELIQNNVVTLDKAGDIVLISTNESIRLTEFLRAVFVRLAKVKHISSFLKKIMTYEGLERYVRNQKLLKLMKPPDLDVESDEGSNIFEDTIGGGMNNKPVKNSKYITWHIFK